MTTRRISGKDYEERLRTKLGTWCDIAYDSNYDHTYKIDFTITRFKDTFFTNPIGVQVTLKDDDVRKQSEFLSFHQHGKVVPKSVFLEITPGADLDGVATVAYFALGTLTFGKEYKDKDAKVIGIRIDSDLTYEFFDIEENTRKLRVVASRRAEENEAENLLTGELFSYKPERGFGFIKCPSRGEDFFLHISNAEVGLQNILLDQAETQSGVWNGYCDPPIPVRFVDGGYKSSGTNPIALYVRPG